MGKQNDSRRNRASRADTNQCGDNSANAPLVELRNAEISGLKVSRDDLRDEKTGQHEKYVDADVPTGKGFRPEVTKKD
jgi:hypothetical protein